MDIKDSAGESSKRSEKHYRENLNFLWESLNHHEQTVLRNLDFKNNANHTNTLTQESFSLVGEAEVRDSKHDRSTIHNGQLKDGGSHKLRNVSKSDPWSAAPSERMETITAQPQDLDSASNQNELGSRFFPLNLLQRTQFSWYLDLIQPLRPSTEGSAKIHWTPWPWKLWDNKFMLFTGGSLW